MALHEPLICAYPPLPNDFPSYMTLTQSAGAVEYADRIFAEN